MTDSEAAGAAGRDLFRYVVALEWSDYRAIMGIFADTFFSEFTPEDVAGRLAAVSHPLAPDVIGERLESLRRWGNLTVSSAVGNPQSIQDYYRRRNRYLITRAGQEVHPGNRTFATVGFGSLCRPLHNDPKRPVGSCT